MSFKTIKDINLQGKRILVRVDFNLTLLCDNQIADDFRLKQGLETITYLQKKNCIIYLLSHLGRPKGKWDKRFSMRPVFESLRKKVSPCYFFCDDYTTEAGRQKLNQFQKRDVVLLENVRFYPGEEKNDLDFAKKLAMLGDIFVNDAFGVCHRKQASVIGIPKFLPSCTGLLLEKEINAITKIINDPKKPLVAIIGGAKIEDKLPLVGKLINLADWCLLGGRVANMFLTAEGRKAGIIWLDQKQKELIKKIFVLAAQSQTALVLPKDLVWKKEKALDIGPKTRKEFSQLIKKAKTIIWVGPLGVYEKKRYSLGTETVYEAICQNRQSLSLVGGGDTLAALKNKHYLTTIDHISTGGGAMLEFIEKGTLAGIEALKEKS